MLDLGLVQKHLQALESGGEASRRQAVIFCGSRWSKTGRPPPGPSCAPSSNRCGGVGMKKQPANRHTYRQEVATALGSLGPASRLAIPELVELLQEGVPDAQGHIVGQARRADGYDVAFF